MSAQLTEITQSLFFLRAERSFLLSVYICLMCLKRLDIGNFAFSLNSFIVSAVD